MNCSYNRSDKRLKIFIQSILNDNKFNKFTTEGGIYFYQIKI